MQFSTNLGLPNLPDSRGWGANSWWQNTRLPYGNMLASADFNVHANILEFFLQMTDFSTARTMFLFNHTGIFYTETKTLYGAYALRDYGYRKPYVPRNITKTPVAIEGNPFIRFDCKQKARARIHLCLTPPHNLMGDCRRRRWGHD